MSDAFGIVVGGLLVAGLVATITMHAWDVARAQRRAGREDHENHGDGI